MARDDKTEHRIQDPAQIAELVSPVRMEIIDAMASIGPASIAELAEELGRPADSLYYHVRRLVKCGLVYEVEEDAREGRQEAVFDVPSRRMYLAHDPRDPERMRLIADASSAMLRQTDRNLRSALLSGADTGSGLGRHTWSGRSRAWLTAEEVERVNGMLRQISEIYFAAERREDAKLHSFTFVMSPLPVGRRRRQGELRREEGREEEREVSAREGQRTR